MPEAERPQPAEERSYLAFAAAALLFVLVAGLILGILAALGVGGLRLVEAHGWTQLHGWIGLFVAGMGLRLVPRLAGRRPLPSGVTVAVLVLLVAGAVMRILAAWIGPLALPSAALSTGGALLFSASIAVALTSRGRRWQAWRLAAWAGAASWLGWAALEVAGAVASNRGVDATAVEAASDWVSLLGALSNFVWAVQGRSVPVFYGRRQPGMVALAPPLALLNAGVVLVFLSAFGSPRALAAGLLLGGIATAWLAPVAGSVWGRAHRLRPPSQPASRFILAANVWAAVSGVLLVGAGAGALAGWSAASALRDAALHAGGLGFMTTLIVGMAQLLMPSFAGERITAVRRGPESWLSWPLLLASALLRTGAPALPAMAQPAVIATSGVLAWLALAVFAAGLARAVRNEARNRASGLRRA